MAGRARPHHGAGCAVGLARIIARVVFLICLFLTAQLLDLLVDLRLHGLLLLRVLILHLLIGINIRLEVCQQCSGLGGLLLQFDLLGLKLGLLILQLDTGVLKLGLDGLNLFTGSRHVGLHLFIVCNDLADHVHTGKKIGEAGRLEQDGNVGHLAVLLEMAHAAAEAHRLCLFLLLCGLKLNALVLDLLVIGSDLLLNDLDLLLRQVHLLIQRGLLLNDAGLFGAKVADGLLLLLLLGLQLFALLRELIDLRLRRSRCVDRDQRRHERDDKDQRQQHTNNGSNDFAICFHSFPP